MRAKTRLFAACGLLLASASWALEPAAPGHDLGAEAELHFDIGVRAYARGDYEKALEHLLLSNRLAANRKVVFNIARAYEGLGKPAVAWSHYAEFAASESDAELRGAAEEAMERLAGEVALIRVESGVAGAAIFVGRRDLGQRGTTPRTVAVSPGSHRIRVESPGFLPAEGEVLATVGEVVRLDLVLEPVRVPVQLTGPPGAEVRLADGATLGRLPLDVQLPVGEHRLDVRADGFRPQRVVLQLAEGRPEIRAVDLEAATGTVVISGPVEGARVEVDGEALGFLPLVAELPVGPHHITVGAEAYRTADIDVVVRDGETTEVGVRMVPITELITASRVQESLLDAPSTAVVISRQDIRDRGYTDLAEMVADLPGFDAIVANGVTYMLAYQRGYRTPQTQRTLLLTDGRDENLMWSQSAELSRQFPFTDIERIEVLYGPSSAVWGPNAFLGVINVVTRDADDLESGEHEATVQVGAGSFSTGLVDAAVRGRLGNVGYSIAGRGFVSAEPNLNGRWGFVRDAQLADEALWGPLLTGNSGGPFELEGRPLGRYADPTEDYGLRGRIFLGGLELGVSSWTVSEGYGPYYATDRAQPVAPWNTQARRVWAQYEGELSDQILSRTLVQHKQDRIWGSWAEASPTGERESRVSLTEWNAPSSWWEARQLFTWQPSTTVQALAGARWIRKDLTRKYDVPGYWEGQFSSQPVPPESGVGYSADESYTPPPAPLRDMPAVNRVNTDDLGGFGQVIADAGRVRLNVGLRYDYNSQSDQGQLSPRTTAIWRFAQDRGALKLIYGHAFQEPSARQLWGEWDGRGANPGLTPEQVDNGEVVLMLRTPEALVEGSAFGAQYTDVLQEEGQNDARRQIGGFEARGRWSLANPFRATRPVDSYANYTFTATRSTHSWSPRADAWIPQPGAVGDIAPHKANAGVLVPMWGWASTHVRTNIVSSRTPYSRNPLRRQDFRFPTYALFDALLEVRAPSSRIALHIDNVFDAKILQPGAESADAGNNFDARSEGYHNSAIPLPGRAFFVTWTSDFVSAP